MNNNYDFYQQPDVTLSGEEGLPNKKKSGYATASLVLSILAVVFTTVCCCCLYLTPILSILSIVFAIVAKRKNGQFTKMMIAGLVLAILALVIFLLIVVVIYQITAPLKNMTFEEALQYFAELAGMSQEELQAWIEETYGMSYEEFLEQFGVTEPLE